MQILLADAKIMNEVPVASPLPLSVPAFDDTARRIADEMSHLDIAEMAAGDGTLVFVNPNVPFYTTLTITAIIIIAGVIAGYIPARQAGKMKIVDALVFTK